MPSVSETVKDLIGMSEEDGPGRVLRVARATEIDGIVLKSRWFPRLGTGPAVHFAVFVVLGLGAYLSVRGVSRPALFVYLFLIGLVTEILQSFSITRTTEFEDIVMNTLGLGLGLLLYLTWTAVRGATRKRPLISR